MSQDVMPVPKWCTAPMRITIDSESRPAPKRRMLVPIRLAMRSDCDEAIAVPRANGKPVRPAWRAEKPSPICR